SASGSNSISNGPFKRASASSQTRRLRGNRVRFLRLCQTSAIHQGFIRAILAQSLSLASLLPSRLRGTGKLQWHLPDGNSTSRVGMSKPGMGPRPITIGQSGWCSRTAGTIPSSSPMYSLLYPYEVNAAGSLSILEIMEYPSYLFGHSDHT